MTTFFFDSAGDLAHTVDAMGTKTCYHYDDAGRRIRVVENCKAVSGSSSSGLDADVNKTTRFEYNLDNNMTKLICENPTTGTQVTEWEYGVDTSKGSLVASNGLVYKKKYPDGSLEPMSTDNVSFKYNQLGEVIWMKDQGGTQHSYERDKFGRLTADTVTLAGGSAIDPTVKRIRREYEVRGMLSVVTSEDEENQPINQVELVYNEFSQLSEDRQEHEQTVDGSTLKVQYGYENGSGNTVRPVSVTYPDETSIVSIGYSGDDANNLSRPNQLIDGTVGGGTLIVSYRYLGLGRCVGIKYEEADELERTYQTGSVGDAGDKYTGLDRFGRLVETIWKEGGSDQVHSKYGRTRFGGPVWHRNEKAHALSKNDQDDYYWYDGLYQVEEHRRGNLTGSFPNYTGVSSVVQDEIFYYDATGNWRSASSTNPLNSQTRTHNMANEITNITSTGSGSMNPSYDGVGNMQTMPKDLGGTSGSYTMIWDGWNRLVELKDGGTSKAKYVYDGLTRRVSKEIPGTEVRHYYYNQQWRALEERVEGDTYTVDRQYTWGLEDRWEMVRRKRSDGDDLNEALWVLRDYLDPVAIYEAETGILERFGYDAFGRHRFMDEDFLLTSDSYNWNFLFHAEFLDTDTNLYNYGYRYYSTPLGRWLSRDPAERIGENLYWAFSNASAQIIDMIGLEEEDWHRIKQYLIPQPEVTKELVKGFEMTSVDCETVKKDGKECCHCKRWKYEIWISARWRLYVVADKWQRHWVEELPRELGEGLHWGMIAGDVVEVIKHGTKVIPHAVVEAAIIHSVLHHEETDVDIYSVWLPEWHTQVEILPYPRSSSDDWWIQGPCEKEGTVTATEINKKPIVRYLNGSDLFESRRRDLRELQKMLDLIVNGIPWFHHRTINSMKTVITILLILLLNAELGSLVAQESTDADRTLNQLREVVALFEIHRAKELFKFVDTEIAQEKPVHRIVLNKYIEFRSELGQIDAAKRMIEFAKEHSIKIELDVQLLFAGITADSQSYIDGMKVEAADSAMLSKLDIGLYLDACQRLKTEPQTKILETGYYGTAGLDPILTSDPRVVEFVKASKAKELESIKKLQLNELYDLPSESDRLEYLKHLIDYIKELGLLKHKLNDIRYEKFLQGRFLWIFSQSGTENQKIITDMLDSKTDEVSAHLREFIQMSNQ